MHDGRKVAFLQVSDRIFAQVPVIPKLRSSCTGLDNLSNVSIPAASPCPACGGPLTSGGMVLSKREDDGQRVCRMLFRCVDRHVWWRWADQSADELEPCPHPQLFRR